MPFTGVGMQPRIHHLVDVATPAFSEGPTSVGGTNALLTVTTGSMSGGYWCLGSYGANGTLNLHGGDFSASVTHYSGGVGAFATAVDAPAGYTVIEDQSIPGVIRLEVTGVPTPGSAYCFCDGLRCAGNNVIRLVVATSSGAGTSDTTVMAQPVSVKGVVNPGDVRRYQPWYRDPVGSPCGNKFNLTNGYEVQW